MNDMSDSPQVWRGVIYEAACVSLSRNHTPPQDFDVVGDETQITHGSAVATTRCTMLQGMGES